MYSPSYATVCLFVFSRDEAWENSPDNYLDRIYSNCGNVKVKVAVGGMESPELIRQSKSFYKVGINVFIHRQKKIEIAF